MKKYPFLIIFLTSSMYLFAQNNGSNICANNVAIQGGVGLGTIIAVVISWSRNESVFWAILHGILGWLYVIYYMIIREKE